MLELSIIWRGPGLLGRGRSMVAKLKRCEIEMKNFAKNTFLVSKCIFKNAFIFESHEIM